MKRSLQLLLLANGFAAAVCVFTQFRLRSLTRGYDQLVAESTRLGVLSPSVRTRDPQQEIHGAGFADSEASAKVARKNSEAALKRLVEMNSEDRAAAMAAIIATGKSNFAQKTVVLAALRDCLGTISDETLRQEIRDEAFEALARNAGEEPLDSVIRWISESGFTAPEAKAFAGGLAYLSTKGETGRWIEWVSANLPPDQQAEPVTDLIGDWTLNDYQAAGNWLSAAPESLAKQVAVQAYVEAVASYEPQTAIQWAMTLPPGTKRNASLAAIHQNWPSSDSDGKAAFEREHDME